ncbi:MAG: hypothetical protein HHJ14_12030 [Cellulomonas sp.]|uniref:hypothetical protein n=1 Tax=Cellulomonas sp. TaxID=40001 RepID=UPI0017E4C3C3|nr:hypothetical protein [Cellulomonas sp.]NMM17812.1 hypothetical protein [Cellulomonas sp.]NMM29866.1 hypothetical protein [Cellulomonas sp.]
MTRHVAVGTGKRSQVLRGLVAACVLLSAVVHLDLWVGGMRFLPVIGPAFLGNVVAGIVIGLAVLILARPEPLLLAGGFGLATLGAFVVSTLPSGLFGVHQTWTWAPALLAAASEVGAILLAGAALVVERRATARPDAAGTASMPSRSGSAASRSARGTGL